MREKIVPAVFLMLVLLIGFPSSAVNFSVFADDDDEIELEAELVDPSTGEDGGKAKFEKRSDRTRLSVEIEDQDPETTFDVVLSSLTIATITTDGDGFGDLNLDDRHDDVVPSVSVGDIIEIFNEAIVVLTGIFSPDDEDDDHDYPDKVTLCHVSGKSGKTVTITVDEHALYAHLAHGDYEELCDYDPESSLAKIEAKLAKKYEKLQEKRYEFEQKQIELAEKYAKKLAKLESKYVDKEAKLTEKYNLKLQKLSEELAERHDKYLKKSEELQQKLYEKIDKLDLRTQKLVENFNSGEYFGEVVEVQDETRKYVLKFDSLTGESFTDPSTTPEFFAEIILESFSSGSDHNLKFKVTGCSIIGEDISYSCAFGKARTVSSGSSGDEEKLTIMAFLEDDDSESTSSLKVFVTPVDSSFASLEDGVIDVTMKGSITLQWSLSGAGTMSLMDNSKDNP